MVQGVDLPQYSDLLWPALLAVRGLGGVAKLEEIDERVIFDEGFSEEQLAILHKDGPRSEIEYRLAWARTYLKSMGILDNSVARKLDHHRVRETGEGAGNRAASALLP
jgi:restriction system protein